MNPQTNATQTTVPPPSGVITQLLHKIAGSSFEILPLLLFILYVIGYICLNVHLSRYPIVETNIISFNYIKSSLVFIVFVMPMISVSRKLAYEFNSFKRLSNVVIFFYLIAVYCFVFFIYDYFTLSNAGALTEKYQSLAIKIIIYTYFPFAVGLSFSKTKNKYLLIGFLLAILFNIGLFCFFSKICFSITFYIIPACIVFFLIFYIDIHNPLAYNNNKSLLLPIYGFLFACIIAAFGGFVYNKIPQVLGGGKPYAAMLYLTKSEQQSLKESCVFANDDVMQQQLRIIYSSDKGFYAYAESGVIVIPIETIKGIRVQRKFWFNSYM